MQYVVCLVCYTDGHRVAICGLDSELLPQAVCRRQFVAVHSRLELVCSWKVSSKESTVCATVVPLAS